MESNIQDDKSKACEKFTAFILSKEDNDKFFLNYKTEEDLNILIWRSKYKTTISNYQHTLTIEISSEFIEEVCEETGGYESKIYLLDIINFNPEDNDIGEKLYSFIKNLKYSKYYGVYQLNNKCYMFNRISSLDIEKELFPEYFENMICSVCYENTETRTNCGHLLCFNCWEIIVKKVNCRCPECRICIKTVNSECYNDCCKCKD